MNKFILVFLTLFALCLPVMADMGNDAGVPSGNLVSAAMMPQSTVQVSITEYPKGKNLSEMIRRSRPFNGLNPTLKPGESLVQLPFVLNDVTMLWQSGTYKGGWYTGYLEKGESVYVWTKQYPEYTDYTLSRGRCGNPAKPVCFRIGKAVRPQPVVIHTSSSTTTVVEKTKYCERKEGPGLLSFSQSKLVPDKMPETVLGPRTEVRVGLLSFDIEREQNQLADCGPDPLGDGDHKPVPPVPYGPGE